MSHFAAVITWRLWLATVSALLFVKRAFSRSVYVHADYLVSHSVRGVGGGVAGNVLEVKTI